MEADLGRLEDENRQHKIDLNSERIAKKQALNDIEVLKMQSEPFTKEYKRMTAELKTASTSLATRELELTKCKVCFIYLKKYLFQFYTG